MTRRNRIVLGIASLGLAAGLGYAIRAAASGIPSTNALSYAGVLEDANGPLTGSHNIQVIVYDAATAGNNLCQSTPAALSITDGHYSVPLPDACTAAVGGNPNVWIDVFVDGADTGRTKIGAVPYAVEANHAVNADTATGPLAQQVVPSGAVVAFNLSACPAGWSAYAAGGGRTIVGVNAAGGNGLSQRNLGATLGEEQHTLTVSEMPSHTHTATDLGHTHTVGPETPGLGDPAIGSSAGTCGLTCMNVSYGIEIIPSVTSTGNANISVQATGGGTPFNNLQPSVALLFCQKN